MAKNIHRRHDANPEEGIEKYGEATFADPTNNKYPIDTPGRIKAAWAYIHQPRNSEKYTAGELRIIRARIRQRQRVGRWRCRIRTSSWS